MLPSPTGTRRTKVASLPIFVDSFSSLVGLQMLVLYALEALLMAVSAQNTTGEYFEDLWGM